MSPIRVLLLSTLLCFACNVPTPSGKQFTSISPKQSGLDFRNDVPYTDAFNCYTYRNFYNGGGVAIGDVDKDGLPDLFFCSNTGSNRLYRNKGDLHFEDVTESAGLASKGIWTAGVAFVDINADGLLDIYITKSGPPGGEKRYNELFINQSKDGNLHFEEQSKAYGLDFTGLSTHAAFFDYDKDGDLDCYLLNNSIRSVGGYDLRPDQRNTPDPEGGNKLLRNNSKDTKQGHPIFEDVSAAAGIYRSAIGFGLGVTIGDYDLDGWQDMFISNDFFEKDYLYHNKGDGTFEMLTDGSLPELSKGSMGADMADLNNDGFPEIFVTEMTPAHEKRYKTKAAFDNWNTYLQTEQTGYHRQFGRNVLQLNNGDGSFSEVGRQAGVWATDWSWGALLADFDNDGWKDIFVANGIGKDLLDQDYLNFYSDPAIVRKMLQENPGQGIKALIDKMPSEPQKNYFFRNKANSEGLSFEDVSAAWGISEPSFSNGSAYGDLDNDGDLDLVINNVNAPCALFRNDLNTPGKTNVNYLKVALQGSKGNPFGLGTKVKLKVGEQYLYQELAPMRGFESCVDYSLHFGLGTAPQITRIEVTFPSGAQWTKDNVQANQSLTVSESDAVMPPQNTNKVVEKPTRIFEPVPAPDFRHSEHDFSDFDVELLNFRMFSAEGALATGDVNGDGLADLFIGGAAGQSAVLFLQDGKGRFNALKQPDFEKATETENVSAAFFDADGDQDLDVYVASGSSEFEPGSPEIQDHLFFNDGRGHFTLKASALPQGKPFSSACVRPADYDRDGDMDLFVGMRGIAGQYGQGIFSFLMTNDGKGNFAPKPMGEGWHSTSDAAWSDIDGDGDMDLIAVGEWEPIHVFQNQDGELKESTHAVADSEGWWNCIQAVDLDGDGDDDFVLGNAGLNSRFRASKAEPMTLYVHDFDKNGRSESLLCQFDAGKQYPLVQRNDLLRQMPGLKKKYLKFEDYAGQSVEDMFGPDALRDVVKKDVYCLESSILWNIGGGQFERTPLPYAAQQSPMFAIAIKEGKGLPDLILAGNHERCKPETGIYMGSYGCYLKNLGNRQFASVPQRESGLKIEGVTRGLAMVKGKTGERLVVARNNRGMLVFGER